MTEIKNAKHYDLEEKTFKFAERCRDFIKKLPRTNANFEYGKQLIRSSGSQAANYIEANEAISKKDFVHRIKISRKEAKETIYWLKLIETGENESMERERSLLIQEATEFIKIFNSILSKSE
jgi:four helix bundle protein